MKTSTQLKMEPLKILIVEDKKLGDTLKECLEHAGGSMVTVSLARSKAAADAILRQTTPGGIAYCIADLDLPETTHGNDNRSDKGNTLGFEVVRDVTVHSPHVRTYILSAYADEDDIVEKRAALRMAGINLVDVLHKDQNRNNYLRVLCKEISYPNELWEALSHLGARVVHLSELRLARTLWEKACNVSEVWKDVPIITIMGKSRSGKDHWAEMFAAFRLKHNPLVSHPPPSTRLDVAQIGDNQAGAYPQTTLFGARNFQNLPDSSGVFVSATFYLNRGLPPDSFEGTDWRPGPNDMPHYGRSKTAILTELGKLHINEQKLLLDTLDSNPAKGGWVKPAGSNDRVRIGCPIVFTTNASIEELVKSGVFLEDLYKRLRAQPRSWLKVPSFSEMGIEAFHKHLQLALNKIGKEGQVAWSPSAKRLIVDAFKGDPDQFTNDTIDTIAKAFSEDSDLRLNERHLNDALGVPRRDTTTIDLNPRSIHPLPDISAFANEGIVKEGDKKYVILNLIVEATKQSKSLKTTELASRLNELLPDSPTTIGNLTTTLSRLKHEIERHQRKLGVALDCKNRIVRLVPPESDA